MAVKFPFSNTSCFGYTHMQTKRIFFILLVLLIVGSSRDSFVYRKEVVGATLASFNEEGQAQILNIKDVQIDSRDPSEEIYLYTVEYQQANGQWQNLCFPDSEGIAKAIPLSGRWDRTGAHLNDSSITFACTSGALAKCVRWGYMPWKRIDGESLRDYHQACTRMVRADYCGDGVGHTKEGTEIDVYDRLGLQQRTRGSGMTFEAAWGADGVVQLNHLRFEGAIAQLKHDCPKKMASAQQAIRYDSHYEGQFQPKLSDPLIFNDSFVQLVK
ncbi:hypothetical protein S7335_3622 [Synechococcus sp. PCC 7335]|nr:hypothetical protein S7335_3622 [Synechococcus sp. PCC 7335]